MVKIKPGMIQKDSRVVFWLPSWDLRAMYRGLRDFKHRTGLYFWNGNPYNPETDEWPTAYGDR